MEEQLANLLGCQSQEPWSVDSLAKMSGYSLQEPQSEVKSALLWEFYLEIVREPM